MPDPFAFSIAHLLSPHFDPGTCLTDLLAALPPGPFARLATLLGDVKPGKDPISLSIGDPYGQVPDFVSEALPQSVASSGTYPAINGTPDWRQAAAGWLNTRFGLN